MKPRTSDQPRNSRPYIPVAPHTASRAPQPIPKSSSPELHLKKRRQFSRKKVWITLLILFVLIVGCIGSAYLWYQQQLSAYDSRSTQGVRVVINSGDSPEEIAAALKNKKLIKSAEAFRLYVRAIGKESSLQAGTYTISANMSVKDIVAHLSSGKSDTITLTFLPGATVSDDKQVMIDAGYSKSLVDAAFSKSYDHPLFSGKPASADLEGYIYGDTYEFNADDSLEIVLNRLFDEMYGVVRDNDLVARFKKQNLSLYQGITLASIVQREVPDEADQKLVAGVFYNRLKQDINLGSDVTYQYIADKTGKARDPNLDSPYNTRRYKGLPPGPIANPGKSALLATASPAASDYLFFLSGDDDKTYFAKTDEEHAKNITEHCQKKCSVL